jgi:hypothetical protein
MGTANSVFGIEPIVKSFRWILILLFALLMARPSTKRCSTCVDSCSLNFAANPGEFVDVSRAMQEPIAPVTSSEFELDWNRDGKSLIEYRLTPDYRIPAVP